ncbi:Hypothetical predicted protein [Olea europaea subsp. europaea]|uniref:Uncharacterized protein n=1 Tax=Olea europaea subsp. europaea TaxID=158383 RepID=A0A8S0Q8Z2_OLEEU|nr:Hypothetical predicted protein [Olea europaea subsp. europaea]
MKQSKISCFTEEEIGVAGILLDLGNSVVGSESRHYLLWGSKRRRSTRDAPAPAPVSESPSINGTEIEIEPRVIVEVPSTSPTTPLSFSPSESDEKSKHSSKKKTKENYMEVIDGLTKRRDLLKGEVENVRNHYNKLKAYNMKLKSMKEKALTTCLINEGSHMGMSSFLNFEMNLAQHYQITAVPHHQPFNLDQMATGSSSSSSQIRESIHYPFIPMAPSSNGLEHVNQVGPVGLPDLNLSPEEAFVVEPSQPLDVNRDLAGKRARFAEARRLRRGIIKIKLTRSGVKTLRSR